MVLTRLSHAGEVCPLDRPGAPPPSSSSSSSSAAAAAPALPVDLSAPATVAAAFSAGSAGTFRLPNTPQLHILDMPVEILEKIFGYLSCSQIGKLRLVCHRLNSVCVDTLAKLFTNVRLLTQQRFITLKSQMPRRESLRRKHPLVSQCDVLDTINMRLALLYMTFGKHVERRLVGFFPASILDEVYRLLDVLNSNSKLANRNTDELFDLSSMAMEYFKEQLEPRLPDPRTWSVSVDGSPDVSSTCVNGSCASDAFSDCMYDDDDDDDEEELHQQQQQQLDSDRFSLFNTKLVQLAECVKKSGGQLDRARRELNTQKERGSRQAKLIRQYSAKLVEHHAKLGQITHKMSSVIQELNECKSELHQWRRHSGQCVRCCGGLATTAPATAAVAATTVAAAAAGAVAGVSGSTAAAQEWLSTVGDSSSEELHCDDNSSLVDLTTMTAAAAGKVRGVKGRRVVRGRRRRRAGLNNTGVDQQLQLPADLQVYGLATTQCVSATDANSIAPASSATSTASCGGCVTTRAPRGKCARLG